MPLKIVDLLDTRANLDIWLTKHFCSQNNSLDVFCLIAKSFADYVWQKKFCKYLLVDWFWKSSEEFNCLLVQYSVSNLWSVKAFVCYDYILKKMQFVLKPSVANFFKIFLKTAPCTTSALWVFIKVPPPQKNYIYIYI